ncbi:hypothetical protein [Microcoleus sp. B9-D4]|uniref:hypothetical protein n=1 Tax=Microcoleus sp. B9-D4 TaxID=2818711 RepID=UPI0040409EB7
MDDFVRRGDRNLDLSPCRNQSTSGTVRLLNYSDRNLDLSPCRNQSPQTIPPT